MMTNDTSAAPAAADPDEDASICPLTLKPLPSSDLDVGVIYDSASPFDGSKCGHRCTLEALIRYIQGEPVDGNNEKIHNTTSKGGAPVCPICHVPIMSVCDGIVASEKLREKAVVVCFRYAKQNYYLSVPKSCAGTSGWSIFKRASTAQDRIANVLGMSTKSGGLKVGFFILVADMLYLPFMVYETCSFHWIRFYFIHQILHKGKVLSNPTIAADEISNQLIGLSKLSSKGGKPSLVVMGTRAGKEVINAPGTASHSYRAVSFSIFRWGVTFLFNTTRNVIGGIFLFAKTLFILPAQQEEDDNRRRRND